MKEAVVIGAVAGVIVLLLQGFVPRVGSGELAFLVRLIFAAIIGGISGMIVRIIRR